MTSQRVEQIGLATLGAPFPWFGGKRFVAKEVWTRLGSVENYVEPFLGSGAVLLARLGGAGKIETVNDANRYLANFWRAVSADPDAVAHYADWPVNEADLHARHWWLLTEGAARIAQCEGDPSHYDAQVAGWWVWGACAWIGSGWCSGEGPWIWANDGWLNRRMPHVGNAGRGLNRKIPHVGDAGRGLNRQIPHVGDAGQGLNRQIPHVGNAGRGLNRQIPHVGAGQGLNRQIPHVGNAGQGRSIFIRDWLSAIRDRMRHVRVTCGDWSRVCGPSVTHGHGLTGVFLDPPYGVEDRATVYSNDDRAVAAAARVWAIEQGRNPLMRIAFAGYDGEHDFPDDWTCYAWKSRGGYGSQGDHCGRANAARERLWFSPHCLTVEQPQGELFRDGVQA